MSLIELGIWERMALQGEMRLVIWDVQHGACAMVQHILGQYAGRLAMIDSGPADDDKGGAGLFQMPSSSCLLLHVGAGLKLTRWTG
ncbi:MAG: hypothetical protein RBS40_16370 [Rhodocyclaceae bacterium]|jgi:hypothetical protein|nr:hypothetical protein [Rhodocyclaceae bacterium]